jgi:hypothetical protein
MMLVHIVAHARFLADAATSECSRHRACTLILPAGGPIGGLVRQLCCPVHLPPAGASESNTAAQMLLMGMERNMSQSTGRSDDWGIAKPTGPARLLQGHAACLRLFKNVPRAPTPFRALFLTPSSLLPNSELGVFRHNPARPSCNLV